MRVYLDSSAAIKRVVAEAETTALGDCLDEMTDRGDVFLSSDLIRIELCRALLRIPRMRAARLGQTLDDASGDIALEPVNSDVVALAMRLQPKELRSLDAIHMATAVLLDVDLLVTYDRRLQDAGKTNGIAVRAPTPNMFSGDS